jgi:hypothetical protein
MIKRLLARWKLWLTILLVLPFLLLGILQWLLSRWAQPAALVERIEATYNCRAEVTGASVKLWSLPAKVTLQGLKLSARDADADAARPIAERLPLEGKAVILGVENLDLSVSLWGLLRRNLQVDQLLVQQVNLYAETPEQGSSALNTLFTKPLIVAGKPNPALIKQPDQPVAEPVVEREFRAKDLPLAPAIANARIEHVRLDFKNMKSRQLVRFENANLVMQNVVIDGGHLAQKNHLGLVLDGRFQIFAKKMAQQVDLGVQLQVDTAPFDPKTGHVQEMPFGVMIAKDSTVQDLPALKRIYEKMKKWEKYGLKVEPLPDRATIQNDARVAMTYGANKLTTHSEFLLALDNYELALHRGSWFDVAAETCQLDINITGSKSTSDQALNGLREFVRGEFGNSLGGPLVDKVIEMFRKENLILPDGRLSIPMGLTGPTGKPEVEDRVTPILENALIKSLIPGL